MKPMNVKLALSKIEFVYKNRFKGGWFHLLKFMKKVKELPEVKDELIEFSKNNKLVKPESGVIVVLKPTVDRKTVKKRPGLTLGKKTFTLTHGLDKEDD
jgi:hypothetical protein